MGSLGTWRGISTCCGPQVLSCGSPSWPLPGCCPRPSSTPAQPAASRPAHLTHPAGHPSPSLGTRAREHGLGTLWRASAHQSGSWWGGEKQRETLGPGLALIWAPRGDTGISASRWGSGDKTSAAAAYLPPPRLSLQVLSAQPCSALVCRVTLGNGTALSGLSVPIWTRKGLGVQHWPVLGTTPVEPLLLTPTPPGPQTLETVMLRSSEWS